MVLLLIIVLLMRGVRNRPKFCMRFNEIPRLQKVPKDSMSLDLEIDWKPRPSTYLLVERAWFPFNLARLSLFDLCNFIGCVTSLSNHEYLHEAFVTLLVNVRRFQRDSTEIPRFQDSRDSRFQVFSWDSKNVVRDSWPLRTLCANDSSV